MTDYLPKDKENLIMDYIILSILQNKLNKELKIQHNSRNKLLLTSITDDLKYIKKQMKKEKIKVFSPEWVSDSFLYYPYAWNNIEGQQMFWKHGLKLHVKEKLEKYRSELL